ncbi:cytochrome c biogenesis protein CcdA [Candidatus Saganbacteria bacterium]|nr:cytochrome c biogenesis protein CcdA [Candidatus Saganbacteria bacterium]
MIQQTNISIIVAFFAGILSFFSPCIFPIIPSYLLYLADTTLKEFNETENKRELKRSTILNAILFVLGFSLVFILLGAAASSIGHFLFKIKDIIQTVGGIVMIFLGLFILGVFKLPFLHIERRLNVESEVERFGSFLMGITFAAAWTPCVGPILGSILFMAGESSTLLSGITLLSVYSLGLAIPFLLSAVLIDYALVYFKKIQKYLWIFNAISGLFLIAMGILIWTGYFQSISSVFNR